MKETSYEKFLDDAESERLRIKIHTEKGNLIDVVVQCESFINNKWIPIMRYDCSHGFFDRDVMRSNGEKEKQVIAISKLRDALSYAEQDIKDRWEFYKAVYEKFKKMTRKEKINRNIGLTFDFLHQVVDNPSIINDIPDGAVLEFVDKDFPVSNDLSNKYIIKVKNTFEPVNKVAEPDAEYEKKNKK